MEILLDDPEPERRDRLGDRGPRGSREPSRWWPRALAALIAGALLGYTVSAVAAAPAARGVDASLETRLSDALDAGDENAVRTLVNGGAYLYLRFDDGTLVDRAIDRCDVDALAMLDRSGLVAPGRADGEPPGLVHFLAACAPDRALAYLASIGDRFSRVDHMRLAVRHGSLELINWMAVVGYPIEVDGSWSALADAVAVRRDDAVGLLLALGADPSARLGDGTVADLVARGPSTPFARAAVASAVAAAEGEAP